MAGNTTMNRRTFALGSGMAAAAAGLAAVSGHAFAEEAAGAYTYADTFDWSAEYDVVVLGLGFAGMAAATAAADEGARVLVCEKAPDGEAGGNSRVCGQMFAYGHEDVDSTLAYYKWLAADRDVPEDMLQTLAEGVANMADHLAQRYGLDRDDFTDMTATFGGWMSPEYPEADGSEVMQLWSTTSFYGQSYLYKHMRARIADEYADKIDVWFETPGTSLVQEPTTGAIIGVEVQRAGETRLVRALNGVVLACGGFEYDPEMRQNYIGLPVACIGGSAYNTGDGVRMAQAVGAKLWHMNAYEGIGCNFYFDSEHPNNTYLPTKITQGAGMYVGPMGRRFFNENSTLRHGHIDLGNGVWDNPVWPERVYAVIDKTQKELIDSEGGFREEYLDLVVECDSIEAAAQAVGCPVENLQQTVDDFNFYVEAGRDYAWGRDVQTMRAFDGQGYCVVRAYPGLLNTQGGPQRNVRAEVLDASGEPIPHLYSAGELGGMTSNMYQGGTNVAECHIFGEIAGANAAVAKDPLPAYVLAPQVECAPAQPGDETDLFAAVDYASEAAEGELVGVGEGIGGDVPVYVTLDADGAIASVRVGENHETEGFGSRAIEQLPEQFVGMTSAEEIDAIDAVSGATLTSDALKDAVKQAMGL